MPTLDILHKDLNKLLGKNLSLKEIEDKAILHIKGEIDGVDGDTLKVDCKETNRPDLWSTEGIARQLKPIYTKEKGLPEYKVSKPTTKIMVENSVNKVRPYIVAAIAKDVKITEELLVQMIQLQEKVCMTFGRKRKEAAIGLYDFNKMTPPIIYKGVDPEEIEFIPLGFKRGMTPQEILEDHPKGQEYAHLLVEAKKYPLVIDSKNVVASFPPIINSEATGKVTENTKDLFIEVTGMDKDTIMVALDVVVAALADRGAKIEAVEVVYPNEKIVSPNFEPKSMKVSVKKIKQVSGLDLSKEEIKKLLEKARYNVELDGDTVTASYPAYRRDILHPIDVIEDVIMAYGYNEIEPEIPEMVVTGSLDEFELFCEKIRNHLVGLGAMELLNFTLTNKNILFTKMNIEEQQVVEIANPVSNQWCVLRNWVTPSLIEFLSKNTSEEYPQQIYELGDVVLIDKKEETGTKNIKRLAWALSSKDANFTKAKQVLDYLLRALNLDYSISEVEHSSFIEGRVGRVQVDGKDVAYIGEINPQVLSNFGIGMPTVVFELNVSEIYNLKL